MCAEYVCEFFRNCEAESYGAQRLQLVQHLQPVTARSEMPPMHYAGPPSVFRDLRCFGSIVDGECSNRESKPGRIDGNDVFYH